MEKCYLHKVESTVLHLECTPWVQAWRSHNYNLRCIYWLYQQKMFVIGFKWDTVYKAYSKDSACRKGLIKNHISRLSWSRALYFCCSSDVATTAEDLWWLGCPIQTHTEAKKSLNANVCLVTPLGVWSKQEAHKMVAGPYYSAFLVERMFLYSWRKNYFSTNNTSDTNCVGFFLHRQPILQLSGQTPTV